MGKENDKEQSLISPAGGAVTKAIKRNRGTGWVSGLRRPPWSPRQSQYLVFRGHTPPQPALHPTPTRFRVPRSGPLSFNKAASLRGFCSNPFPVPARLPSPRPSQRQQGTWQGGCPSLSYSPRGALGFGDRHSSSSLQFHSRSPCIIRRHLDKQR